MILPYDDFIPEKPYPENRNPDFIICEHRFSGDFFPNDLLPNSLNFKQYEK